MVANGVDEQKCVKILSKNKGGTAEYFSPFWYHLFYFGVNRVKKEILNEFYNYVKDFNLNDIAIKRKYEHSLRVMKISCYLAKKLKLSLLDISLSRKIGLLHDFGRFEQWQKYHTYSDLESIDHGDLGVELLFTNKLIKNYELEIENYDIVENAIKYHNKYDYPNNLDKLAKIHCNIIRDADKLDIFYIFAKGILKIEEDNLPVSKKINSDFSNNLLLNRKDVVNKTDDILLILAMVYDLNYQESYKYLYKKKYIWKIYRKLKYKKRYRKYFEHINKYLKERMK